VKGGKTKKEDTSEMSWGAAPGTGKGFTEGTEKPQAQNKTRTRSVERAPHYTKIIEPAGLDKTGKGTQRKRVVQGGWPNTTWTTKISIPGREKQKLRLCAGKTCKQREQAIKGPIRRSRKTFVGGRSEEAGISGDRVDQKGYLGSWAKQKKGKGRDNDRATGCD